MGVERKGVGRRERERERERGGGGGRRKERKDKFNLLSGLCSHGFTDALIFAFESSES